MRRRTDRSPAGPGDRSPAARPPGDETLAIAQLLLELLHLGAGEGGARPGPAHGPAPTEHAPLTPHAMRAAMHVYLHGRRTIGELARGLGISYGWASRVTSELERAGLVRRVPDPTDRRVQRVEMRPEAVERLEAAYRWRADAVERAMAPLDGAGRAAVALFLQRVAGELRGVAPGGASPGAARGDRVGRRGTAAERGATTPSEVALEPTGPSTPGRDP